MGKKEYITTPIYLDLKVHPVAPAPLVKFGRKSLPYVGSVLIKVLGPILGYGIVKNNVVTYEECYVKMKDGTRLATTVYLPKNVQKAKSKCPTVLIRLPYWKDATFKIFGYAFASYGYVIVLQDTRGCAHSEGFNFFLQTEREDGFETLKWITKQYWYNGKIGMAGGSYFGMTQLILSWDNPYLSCVAPAICCYSNIWRNNGGLKIHGLTTAIYQIMINISAFREKQLTDVFTTDIMNLFLNPRFALYNDPIEKKGKYLKFSDFIGKSPTECVSILANFYKVPKWDLSKRNYKTYFKFLDDFLKLEKDIQRMPGVLEYNPAKLSQPAFYLAGWQDMFIEHIIRDFNELQEKVPTSLKNQIKLVIGPWGHADKGHPSGNILEFVKEFLKMQWYEYWLKGNKKALPDINKPPIKYYIIGRKSWRYANKWPPKNIEYKKIYVHSRGKANTMKGDGTLSFEEPKSELEDSYRFDPLKPVITKGGRNLSFRIGSLNQKDAEKRNDVLVYTSEPFEKGMEITGPVKMMLYASSSAKDTDFMVKMVDVYPYGLALNILDGGIRARFRSGEGKPASLIVPGKIYKYEIEVGNISVYIRPKHKLRIEITSSNFPRFDINANMGGEGKQGDYATAEQKIYHNKENPTHLIIPVFK